MDLQPLPAAELLQLAGDPQSRTRYSPFSGQTCLLVDAAPHALSEDEQIRLHAWLRELPCPSIAIAAQQSALAAACDTAVESAAEAQALSGNIGAAPLAACVLVQLLRMIERLPAAEALTAESLAYSTLQAGPEFRRWLEANRAAAPAQHGDEGPAVLVEREDDLLTLELNRPSNRNGMTVELRDALAEALQLAVSDDSIRRIRISGRGKCFSSGGDLTEFGSAPDPASAHLVRSLALPGRLLAACAARAEARVHGACIGSGIEFPAFAGRVVAAPDAWFQLPELRFGLIPGAGGTFSIGRRIGRQRTAWLALSGQRIKAPQALAWGLVDAIE